MTRNGKWVAMDDPPKTPCERCAAKGVQAAHYHFHCPLQNWTEVELPEGAPTPNFVQGRGWEGGGGGPSGLDDAEPGWVFRDDGP